MKFTASTDLRTNSTRSGHAIARFAPAIRNVRPAISAAGWRVVFFFGLGIALFAYVGLPVAWAESDSTGTTSSTHPGSQNASPAKGATTTSAPPKITRSATASSTADAAAATESASGTDVQPGDPSPTKTNPRKVPRAKSGQTRVRPNPVASAAPVVSPKPSTAPTTNAVTKAVKPEVKQAATGEPVTGTAPQTSTAAIPTAASPAASAPAQSVAAQPATATKATAVTAPTNSAGTSSVSGPLSPAGAMSLAALADAVRRELTQVLSLAWTTAWRQTTGQLTDTTPTPVTAAAVPVNTAAVPLAAAAAGTKAATTTTLLANNDTATGTQNTPITGNVLTNDIAPTGKTLTAMLLTGPMSGKVTMNSDGTFTYKPATNFIGTAVFSYVAFSGWQMSVAKVTVNVAAPPAPSVPPTTPPTSTKPIVGVQGLDSWANLTPTQINQALAAAKAAGATSVRIDISWYAVEWTQGTYYWSSVDQQVQQIRAAGLTPMAMIYDTPQWVTNTTNPHTPPANAAQVQMFGQFAGLVAQRYDDQIQSYEIWNEQNIPRFWTGTAPSAATYAQVLQAAYTAIKAVDPKDFVLAGGLSPDASGIDPTTYIQQLYAAGAKGYFDALAYHSYTFPNLPTIDPMAAIHNVMVANGDGAKQIWLTEAGAPTGTGSYAVSQQVQANIVTALLQLAQQNPYIGPVYLYSIMDTGTNLADPESNFGLITRNNVAKLAYYALQKFMTGTSAVSTAAVSV